MFIINKWIKCAGGLLLGFTIAMEGLALPKGSELFENGRLKNTPETANTSSPKKILSSSQDEPLILKQVIQVNGSQVYLSDLFSNSAGVKDKALFPAPEPGQSMQLSKKDLDKLMQQYGLKWYQFGSGGIKISRTAKIINHQIIADIVQTYLNRFSQFNETPMEIRLNGRHSHYYLPEDINIQGEISDWTYDPLNGNFQARLHMPDQARSVQQIALSGRLVKLIEVPVPVRNLSRGDIATYNDLTLKLIAEDQLNLDSPLDIEDVIGKEVRMRVKAGEPFNHKKLVRQRIIKRGDPVQITLITNNMQLVAVGSALEHGALGDVIKVRNQQSLTQIDAVVEGHGRVSVQPFSAFSLTRSH